MSDGPVREYFTWAELREGDFNKLDHSIAIVLFLLTALVLVGSLLILLNKPGWLPFQERSAMLSMLTLTSGLLYAWATLIADEHAPAWLFGGGHTDSSFWFCWLRLVLGFGLWSSALLTRLQAMNKLYLHNEEPLWFLIKLIQYLTPWLVVAMMVTLTADPPISLFSGTLVVSFIWSFYALFVGAPLFPLRRTIPDYLPTVGGLAAGFAANLFAVGAMETERNHGSPTHPARDDGARKFASTTLALLVVLLHWLGSHGPLFWHYLKSDEAFIKQFEPPPRLRQSQSEKRQQLKPWERNGLPEPEIVDDEVAAEAGSSSEEEDDAAKGKPLTREDGKGRCGGLFGGRTNKVQPKQVEVKPASRGSDRGKPLDISTLPKKGPARKYGV